MNAQRFLGRPGDKLIYTKRKYRVRDEVTADDDEYETELIVKLIEIINDVWSTVQIGTKNGIPVYRDVKNKNLRAMQTLKEKTL